VFVRAASAPGEHRLPLEFKTLAGNLMQLGAITVVRWSNLKKQNKNKHTHAPAAPQNPVAKQAPLVFLKDMGISVGQRVGGGVWSLTLKICKLQGFSFGCGVLVGDLVLQSGADGEEEFVLATLSDGIFPNTVCGHTSCVCRDLLPPAIES